eukprot:435550_1
MNVSHFGWVQNDIVFIASDQSFLLFGIQIFQQRFNKHIIKLLENCLNDNNYLASIVLDYVPFIHKTFSLKIKEYRGSFVPMNNDIKGVRKLKGISKYNQGKGALLVLGKGCVYVCTV